MKTSEAELKASPKQKVTLLLARLGLKPFYADTAVKAELEDKQRGITDEPSPAALYDLLDKVVNTEDVEERYRLLLEPVPYPHGTNREDKPELWFDYIDGLTSKDIVRGISKTATQLLPTGRSTWQKAVDLGAGVGYLGSALLGRNGLPRVADSVTLVDLSPELLKVAQARYGMDAETVAADVTSMPFADDTFDLAASTGLVYNLGPELQEPYFKDLSRILRPGGVYLDGDYLGGRRSTKARTVARFQLERLIQMFVSNETPLDPLEDVEDKVAFFDQFGLRLSYQDYKDNAARTNIRIRILQKPTQ